MKKYYYQLVILGQDFGVKDRVLRDFEDRVNELGISFNNFKVVESSNFNEYTDSSPSFCIYLGRNLREENSFLDIEYLEGVVEDASLILPIVEGSLDNFSRCIPNILSNHNGIAVSSVDRDKKIAQIVSNILEAFYLLRKNRRVFISYKRSDSSNIAIQLYEDLEKHSFDVFLDTHSIRPSEPFQDELWHRMADSDVVVLLNTQNFLKSGWTTQELAEANKMNLGMIIVNWPDIKSVERDAEISRVIQLINEDFINGSKKLKESKVNSIIENVESVRARTLASRMDNIISNFMKLAGLRRIRPHLDSHKFITLKKNDKDIILVPAVGIPTSFSYENSSKVINEIKKRNYDEVYILFDETNVRDYWLKHLEWLDNSLDIKTLSIIGAPKWLKS